MEVYNETRLGHSESGSFWRTFASSGFPPSEIPPVTQPTIPAAYRPVVPSHPAMQDAVSLESPGRVASNSTNRVKPATRRVRGSKTSRSSRSGRGGKLQCTPCRVAKKGWDVRVPCIDANGLVVHCARSQVPTCTPLYAVSQQG